MSIDHDSVQGYTQFRSVWEALREVQDPMTRLEIREALDEYAFTGILAISNLSLVAKMFITLQKPVIDKSLQKHASGKLGGSKSTKKSESEVLTSKNESASKQNEKCLQAESEVLTSKNESASKQNEKCLQAESDVLTSKNESAYKQNQKCLQAESDVLTSKNESASKQNEKCLQAKSKVLITDKDKDKDEDKDKEMEEERRTAPSTPFSQIQNLFHEICPRLPPLQGCEGKRKKIVESCFLEFGLEKMVEVFYKANASDFLCGLVTYKKDATPFQADFDWILKKDNFIKILEGKYDNKNPVAQGAVIHETIVDPNVNPFG